MLIILEDHIEVHKIIDGTRFETTVELAGESFDPLVSDMLIDAAFNASGEDGMIAMKKLGAKQIDLYDFSSQPLGKSIRYGANVAGFKMGWSEDLSEIILNAGTDNILFKDG